MSMYITNQTTQLNKQLTLSQTPNHKSGTKHLECANGSFCGCLNQSNLQLV